MGVGANGEEEPLPYVDRVEYLLHQTFEPPLRSTFFRTSFGRWQRVRLGFFSLLLDCLSHQLTTVVFCFRFFLPATRLVVYIEVSEYPFTLQEKGWGEFDMKVMLYFADKSTAPYVVDHDLNFQLERYEVSHTLVISTYTRDALLRSLYL